MPRQVIVSYQAEAQIRTIDAWWHRHRKDSPDLFTVGLAEALSLLEVAPGVADLIGSSQSRVAKMEAGDPSVSIDLLIRTLLALGLNRQQVGRAMGA